MFESLEQEEERMDGPPSTRERWLKFGAISVLTAALLGGLYFAFFLLEA